MLLNLLTERRESVNPLHPKDPALATMFGFGAVSSSGVTVTADTAQQSVTVFACVRVLSDTTAQLPLLLYKREADNRRSRATAHRLFNILRRKPNSFQTASEWKYMMQSHVALRGNAYSEIISTRMAAVDQLLPLHPDRVRPFWVKPGIRAYDYNDPQGGRRVILQDEMFHLMGPPKGDGLLGMNPIELHRNAKIGRAHV